MIRFFILLLTVFTVYVHKEIDGLLEECGNTKCQNGNCENGVCVCTSCYTGPSCELMKNVAPMFQKSSYLVTILQKPSVGVTLVKVTAEDKDSEGCDTKPCPCSKVVYSILDDKYNGLFKMNPLTGELQLASTNINMEDEYAITLKTTNESPFDNVYDMATVFLNTGKKDKDGIEKLGRYRRAAAPVNLTFTLTQTFPTTTLNVTQIGQLVSFMLTITFPVGSNSLIVELFAPVAKNPVMMICNLVVASMGSALAVQSYPAPLLQGLNGSAWPYTTVIFNISNQGHNVASPASLSMIQSVITFDTYQLYYNDTPDSNLIYVSAGAEYSSSTQIWVGQSGYYTSTAVPTPTPNVTLIGDTAVYPGSTAAFDLIIIAPDAYIQLNIGFYTALNDTTMLSFCGVTRYFVGASYSCLPVNYQTPVLSNITINMQMYYPTATMNVGYITNILRLNNSYTATDMNTIKIKMTMRTNPLAWVGGNTYVGVALSVTNNSIISIKQSLPILVKPPKTPYTSAITTVLNYYNTVSTSAIGAITQMILQITIPQNTELDYTILASFLTLNTEVCGFRIYSTGANIPCLNQATFTPTFTLSSDNYQVMASLVIPNLRSVPISTLAADDQIQFLISFRPINDARNAAGNTIQSNVTVLWNGGTSSMLSNSFTLQAAVPPATVANSDLPVFSFQMLGSDGNISVNDARTMNLTITLTPGVVYPNATIAIYMPFNVTARMKICTAKIVKVGTTVMCFNLAMITSNFVYSSKVNDSNNYDTLNIPIGNLGSEGPYTRPAASTDVIVILLDLLVLPHSMNVLNTQTTINAGMMLTSTQIWVGTQNINFVTAPTLAALVAPNIPVIYSSRVDNASTLVWPNDIVIIQYIVKVAGGSKTSLSLQISSDITVTDNFGVCYVNLVNKGNAIPCVSMTPSTVLWTPYSSFVKQYTVQFSNIINSGVLPIQNPSFDDNSLLLEVAVKFGSNLPASFNVIATLTYNTGTVTLSMPFTLQTSLNRFNGTLLANEPVFSFFLMPLFNNTTPNISLIGYGEALRAILNVSLKPSSLQSLIVSFSSRPATVNQMDIVSVNILSVGRNIPCFKTGMLISTTSSRTASLSLDMNTLNLGTICRRDVATNTTPADSQITIEAVFRIWRIPVNNPTSVDINAIAFLNSDEIYITMITINTALSTTQITENYGQNLNITFTPTFSSTTLTINKNATLNVSIWFPPYTQCVSGFVRVYPVWPVGADSALIVSDNTNFTATFGPNVLFNINENLAMNSSSSMNTSQKDNIVVNFGISQNLGTTYRMNKNNYSGSSNDDLITVLFSVRLTDNIAASDGATFPIIICAQFGNLTYNQSITITVSRTNSETIAINGNTTLISNNTYYTQNNEIVVSTIANLLNGSQLECRNLSIQVATPSFINLTSIKNTSYTSPGYSIQQSSFSLGGFGFSVPYFFLTEQVNIIFGMTLNKNTTLTQQRLQSLAVIPIIYSCTTLNWPTNTLGNKIINNVTDVRFQVQGQPIVIPGCTNDLQVWNNSAFADCSISAYNSPFVGFDALKVRNNSGAMWKPHIRGGVYAKFRFIDIVFGTMTTVANVLITSTHPNPPTQVSIYGTMDGRSFSYYTTTNVLYAGTVATITLSNPSFNYMGIRISVTQTLVNDSETGLNIDLVGCPTVNVTGPSFNSCVSSYTKPVTTLTTFYRRGYLYVAPNLFVCDDVPVSSTYLETYPRCFRAYDTDPTTWIDMGPYVGKVVGYDLNYKIVYGIAADLKSYVMSMDDGQSWTSINEGGWKAAIIVSNLTVATEIPWTTIPGFNAGVFGSNCTAYTVALWNFCYDGVYNNGTNQLSWNTCCGLVS